MSDTRANRSTGLFQPGPDQGSSDRSSVARGCAELDGKRVTGE